MELNQEKEKLRKVAEIPYTKLEMQTYLSDPLIPHRMKQLAFKWRSRMIEVGWNYGRKDKCPLCLNHDDTQAHLLECENLATARDTYSDDTDDSDDKNNNIMNNTEHISKQFLMRLESATRKREIILNERGMIND